MVKTKGDYTHSYNRHLLMQSTATQSDPAIPYLIRNPYFALQFHGKSAIVSKNLTNSSCMLEQGHCILSSSAILIYDVAAQKYYDDFTRLNFPGKK